MSHRKQGITLTVPLRSTPPGTSRAIYMRTAALPRTASCGGRFPQSGKIGGQQAYGFDRIGGEAQIPGAAGG